MFVWGVFYKLTNLPRTILYILVVTAHKEPKIWYAKIFPHLGKGAILFLFFLQHISLQFELL